MKKDKITILVLGFITVLITGFAFYNPVEAADTSVYVSPESLSKEVGDIFNVSVKVNPAGEKVCAVEGNLNLDKLSCLSITLGEGIMAQSSPSCSNLYFLFGIPGCSTKDKTLFTIRVRAKSAGTATIGFTGIDIIGEGVPISSNSSEGSYSIVIPETILPPITPICNCDSWSSWQKGDCGEENCIPTQLLQTRTRTCEPVGCELEAEKRCIDDAYCASLPATTTKEDEEESEKESDEVTMTDSVETESLFLATIGNIFSLGTGNTLVAILVGLIILAILIYCSYYLYKKRCKKLK